MADKEKKSLLSFKEFSENCQYHTENNEEQFCSRERNVCVEQNCPLWKTANKIKLKNPKRRR